MELTGYSYDGSVKSGQGKKGTIGQQANKGQWCKKSKKLRRKKNVIGRKKIIKETYNMELAGYSYDGSVKSGQGKIGRAHV